MNSNASEPEAVGPPVLSEELGPLPERGLLERLQSLRAMLQPGAPEVRGWAPVVQIGALDTVNSALALLKQCVENPDILRALAERHSVWETEAGGMDMEECAAHHKRRKDELRAEADRIEKAWQEA